MPRVKKVRLPVPSEHQSQVAFFARVSMDPRTKDLPIFAIANGGHRHISVAKKLKAEGVKAGVPDIFAAVPSKLYYRQSGERIEHGGLFIEMKKPGKQPTPIQQSWGRALIRNDYAVHVCHSADEAWSTLLQYLGFQSSTDGK